MVEFFKYYASFDFSQAGISIVEGSVVSKPDTEVPLYIENPLDRELNVAKILRDVHLTEFQTLCRSAHDCLVKSLRPSSPSSWGLLTILNLNEQTSHETDQQDVVTWPLDNGQKLSKLNFVQLFKEEDS